MRYGIGLLLLLTTWAQAKVVAVGADQLYESIGAAVAANLPLTEDLMVNVSMPTGSWTAPDTVVPNSQWNGFKVIVRGYPYLPSGFMSEASMYYHGGSDIQITAYVEDEAVYEHNGTELQESYVNIKGAEGVEGQVADYSTRYFAKDHLGSIRVTLTAESRHRNEVNYYYSYGRLRQFQVSWGQSKEKFTGKELDAESGLYYFGARYYDPDLGLWISPDPKRQFTSLYSYTGNEYNPINGIDENGEDIVVVNYHNAVGHMGHNAVLIGNDNVGYRWYNKTHGNSGRKFGPHYESVEAFLEAHKDYKEYVRFFATPREDAKATTAALDEVNTVYNPFNSKQHCGNVVSVALRVLGIELKNNFRPNSQFRDAVKAAETHNANRPQGPLPERE